MAVESVADVFAQCPASAAKTAFIADCTQLLADLDTAVSAANPVPGGKITSNTRDVLHDDFLLWAQRLATAIDF